MPTIDAQQQSILRRRQLAQALQQMSMEPLQSPGVPGAKISPWEGINKLAQSLSGNLQNRSLDKEQAALSGKQDNERLAQALAVSNSVVPPSPGPVTPSLMEGQPVPELSPQAPAPVQPPPGMGEDRARRVQALAQALSSSDPQMAKAGEALMTHMLTGTEAEKGRAADLALALGGRDFQQQQQNRAQQFEGGQQAATIANQQSLAQQNNASDVAQNRERITSAEKIAGMKQPSTDPYQTRDVTRNGHIFIQTFAKSDPQAKTISEVDKGPVPAGPQTAAEKAVADSGSHYIDLISKDFAPVTGTLQKISQGQSLMAANNPGANALVAPTILEALVSGQGTGFRMTEAEINQVNKGQGKIGNFQNWLSQWSLDPSKYTSLNADQKKWLSGVLDVAKTKAQAKVEVYNEATDKILAGKSQKDHQTAYRDAKSNWATIDAGGKVNAPKGADDGGVITDYDSSGKRLKK